MAQIPVGVFGSAFDPPTLGHKNAIEQSLQFCAQILLVPSVAHAFAKPMTALEHRLAMLELFCKGFSNNNVQIANVETDIQKEKQGPVFTLDVLRKLEENYPRSVYALTFIMGPDNKQQWHRFYQHETIEKEYSLLVVEQQISVRSSAVRKTIHEQPYEQWKHTLSGMLEKDIMEYLHTNGLYC